MGTRSLPGISAVLITRNEAPRIRRCLESLQWADEIVVVDSCSTDGTPDICRQVGARVISQKWAGFAEQRRRALAEASHTWVLSIDADEGVPDDLRKEILDLRKSGFDAEGYLIRRKNLFHGRWVKGGGWWPDAQLRLFQRDVASVTPTELHEGFQVQGRVRTLRGFIEHQTLTSLEAYFDKLRVYASLGAARRMRERPKAMASAWSFLFCPLSQFWKSYVLRGGIKEGCPGFIIAWLSAFSKLATYGTVWERQRNASPPNLLFVDQFSSLIGGGQRVMSALLGELDRARYGLQVVLPGPGPYSTLLEGQGIPVSFHASGRGRLRYLWASLPTVLWYWRFMRQRHIDLFYANCFQAFRLPSLAARLAGIPTVWHKHVLVTRRRTSVTALDMRFYSWFASRIVAVSDAVRRSLCDLGISKRKIEVIPNGVKIVAADASAGAGLARAQLGVADSDRVVGAVTMLRPEKGLEYLLMALSQVLPAIPDLKAIIVGEASEPDRAYGENLSRLAMQLGLEGRVLFTGWMAEPLRIMSEFDVLALPSLREGFGRVLLEAMTLSKPVVASRVGGVPEIVADGVTGILVPPQDVGALALAITRLLTDPKLAREMGEAGRKRVEAQFALQLQVSRVERLIAELTHRLGTTAAAASRATWGKTETLP
jgi:glycosyltransferase involved in cell wall biosynthesis